MKNDKKFLLFIGRFQPFHLGHDYIIRQALNQNKSVCIALRDTPITEFDPYSAQERLEMISEHFRNDDVKVIIIPDIESINIGRKVGYSIIRYDAPDNIESISATKIRDMIEEGNNEWKEKVPKVIADFLISRENSKYHKDGMVIWFTGLSGAGKSTLANTIKPFLEKRGEKVKILDGDEIRKNLTSDLGFSKKDRSENIKRISYVAKSIADCCGVAIVAAISPYCEDRERAKELIGENRFFEIFVDCSINILKKRDVKGLYAKAISGEIENFTGISDPYEIPTNPNCIINTGILNIKDSLIEIEKNLDNFSKK